MSNPRIKQGHYYKGVEPRGCFNTGAAAVILNSKTSKQYTGYQYIVGRDIDCTYDLTHLVLEKMKGSE